nr:PREDICTED: SLAM family member 5-like isoform X2 [Latimeria chalumnae]|eukprot:XP_014348869.1 PREDICTED: SLAM family member 5-like isoform X2 [Latimeria chalumnae]
MEIKSKENSLLYNTLLILSLLGLRSTNANNSVFLVDGIVENSVCIPLEIPEGNVTELYWRFRPLEPDARIAVYFEGKFNDYYQDRFRSRLGISLSNKSCTLQIHKLQFQDSGIYDIQIIILKDKQKLTKEFNLTVYEAVSNISLRQLDVRSINQSTDAPEVPSDQTCNTTLVCSVEEGSHVTFTWKQNGNTITRDKILYVSNHIRKMELVLKHEDVNSIYSCEASNKVSKEQTTIIPSQACNWTDMPPKPSNHTGLYIGILVVVVAVILTATVIFIKKKKQEKLHREEGSIYQNWLRISKKENV